MSTKDLTSRLVQATRWADPLLTWACAFYFAPGPFKALRRVPVMVIGWVVRVQLSLLKK